MRSTFRWAGTACLFVTIFLTAHSYASAGLLSSTPRNGAAMGAPPKEISITMSEQVMPQQSSIKVFDISQAQMNSGNIIRTSDDKTTITASLPALPSGTYKVRWNTVCQCDDHHSTQGSFIFLVR